MSLCILPLLLPAQVPPEVKTDFEDVWMDAALKTVKEDGNTRYKWVLAGVGPMSCGAFESL
jgi:hypothetical protein